MISIFRWGLLQFRTSPVNDSLFQTDEYWPAREALSEIYRAEKVNTTFEYLLFIFWTACVYKITKSTGNIQWDNRLITGIFLNWKGTYYI